MRTFFTLGLPRSGSAWISNLFTWGNSFCFHEATFGCSSLADLKETFENNGSEIVGTADTAAMLMSDTLNVYFPKSKFLIVVRPREDVLTSLDRADLETGGMDMLCQSLSDTIRDENLDSLVIRFDQLFSQATMQQVWSWMEFTEPFPWRRFELMRTLNIQDVHRFKPSTDDALSHTEEAIERFTDMLEDSYRLRKKLGMPKRDY